MVRGHRDGGKAGVSEVAGEVVVVDGGVGRPDGVPGWRGGVPVEGLGPV